MAAHGSVKSWLMKLSRRVNDFLQCQSPEVVTGNWSVQMIHQDCTAAKRMQRNEDWRSLNGVLWSFTDVSPLLQKHLLISTIIRELPCAMQSNKMRSTRHLWRRNETARLSNRQRMHSSSSDSNKYRVIEKSLCTWWLCCLFLWLCSPARAMASCGSAVQRGLWPPVALQPSAGYDLLWLCSPARAMASCGSEVQRGLWPPVALQPSTGYGLLWLCSLARAMASCGSAV
jgi:hypothetical protein